jgi:hypothetical protein
MGLPEEPYSDDSDNHDPNEPYPIDVPEDLLEVPNIAEFRRRPDLDPDDDSDDEQLPGSGTHFDESRFIHMVINKDWNEVAQYLTEMLTGWHQFDFRQQQIHWDRVLLLSMESGFSVEMQATIGICLNVLKVTRSYGQ